MLQEASRPWLADPWGAALFFYILAAVGTFVPVAWVWLIGVELHPGGATFETSRFSKDARERLQQHFSRMLGTLGFWKQQAEVYRRFHYYTLWWTIPASVTVPIITQAASMNGLSKAFVTCVSAHTAIALALHRGFKVDLNHRSFRQGESQFYDLYRRMLDRPESFAKTEAEQLESYFQQVETLRAFVRNAEIDNTPSIEESKQK